MGSEGIRFLIRTPCRSGAGEGNRTLVVSLEGFCSTIELHPPHLRKPASRIRAPRQPDILVEGEGFEPSKAEPTDLQSAPFDRSGTPPNEPAIILSFLVNVKLLSTRPLNGAPARHLHPTLAPWRWISRRKDSQA